MNPKVAGGHDWSEEYELRRQSVATTALCAERGSLMLAQASGQPYAKSGVVLRLPPQSKKSPTTHRDARNIALHRGPCVSCSKKGKVLVPVVLDQPLQTLEVNAEQR